MFPSIFAAFHIHLIFQETVCLREVKREQEKPFQADKHIHI